MQLFGLAGRSTGVMLVLVAGASSQVGTWANLQPATSPPARAGASIAFEPVTGSVVVYGGATDPAQTTIFGDTWKFASGAWTQQLPAVNPGPRLSAPLAPSPTPGRLVLFGGGIAPGIVDGGTWEFDAQTVTWVNVTPASPSPSARQLATMAYDTARGRTVLFGGTNGIGSVFHGDTWEWDGTTWTQVGLGTGPSPRAWHAMAFDSARSRTVLFGGFDGIQLGDTWEWDGVQWTQVLTPVSPSARSSGAMAFDSAIRRVVMFGGSTGWPIGMNDTWEYDGATWQAAVIVPGSPPTPRFLHSVAGHPGLGGVVTFGGFGDGWVTLGDTWLYTPVLSPATFATFGTGCAGHVGVPILDAAAGQRPLLGRTFLLEFTNLPLGVLSPVVAFIGQSRTTWGSIALPLTLAPWGAPGCTLYTDPTYTFNLANLGGMATWPIAIPNDQSLAGFRFFVQGFVFDLHVNALQGVFSNAGDGVVGTR